MGEVAGKYGRTASEIKRLIADDYAELQKINPRLAARFRDCNESGLLDGCAEAKDFRNAMDMSVPSDALRLFYDIMLLECEMADCEVGGRGQICAFKAQDPCNQ